MVKMIHVAQLYFLS